MVGVLLHIGLHTFRSADRLEIVELTYADDGRIKETPVPDVLPPNKVTVVQPIGSLFFAAATDFGEEMPAADNVERAVVVIVLRGRNELGSTFIQTIDRYETTLTHNGGKLLLSGVSDPVYAQLGRTHMWDRLGEGNIYRETSYLGESTKRAYEDGNAWLAAQEAI